MKRCPKCQHKLPESAFSKDRSQTSGLQSYCRGCRRIMLAAWRAAHPEQVKKTNAAYRGSHPEQRKKAIAAWRATHPDQVKKGYATWCATHSEQRKKTTAAWRAAHPDQIKKVYAAWLAAHPGRVHRHRRGYDRDRCLVDPQFKLASNLRARLHHALRGGHKAGSAIRDLGCTIPELRRRLEEQFKPGMTWGNWSLRGWHVDHIKPLAAFNLLDREQVLQAVNFSNLQPMWASENIRKGARTQEVLCPVS